MVAPTPGALARDDLAGADASATADRERGIARLRVAIMASGTIIFPLLDRPASANATLAYGLLAAGWLYTLALLWLEPYRRPRSRLSTPVASTIDTVIALLWLLSTGGFESPWVIALYGAIAAVALRHRPKSAVVGTLLFACTYVLMGAVLGQLQGHVVETCLRVLYMFFTATVGALVSRERERGLASRLRLLDLTQEVAHIGSWEWRIASNELAWSDELHHIFGIPRDVEPTFEAYMDAIHPDDRAEMKAVIDGAMVDHAPFHTEHRIVTPKEGTRWLHCSGRVFLDESGKVRDLVGSAQDITERRRMQEQLLSADKLASIGTLASGVAHEINNPLAYVANNLELLDRELAGAGPADARAMGRLREAVTAALHGSARVRDIVRGLTSFARKADDLPAPVDVAHVADLAIAIVSHEIAQRTRLVRDYEPVPMVAANESRLSQVLINLLVNATQAIERGGPSSNEILVRIRAAGGERVQIEIVDTGCGIAAENLHRIFDPFFTTKPTGVGIGLGLSICHGIVRDMKGEIDVESTAGKGSTFRVVLPVATTSKATATDSNTARVAAPRPRGRVLIVDDEPHYSASLRMLLDHEYDVALSHSGAAALERLAGGERYEVILCDLMMPEVTGMDFYERLADVAPAQRERVVFLTGGATNDRARAFLALPTVRHLEKPLELPELEALLATMTRPADLGSVTLGERTGAA